MSPTHSTNSSPGWRLAGFVGRTIVGALFVVTGASKIAGIERFVEEVRHYEMLPLITSNAVAYLVPWLEVVAGMTLLLGLWRRESRWIVAAMLVVFTAAKLSAHARGLNIECGCGGNLTFLKSIFDLPQGILTNLLFLALLGFDAHAQGRDKSPADLVPKDLAESCPQ